MDGFKDQQIKRTKTVDAVSSKIKNAKQIINPDAADNMIVDRKTISAISSKTQKAAKNNKKPNPATEKLKDESVKKVPEIKNVKKAEKKAKPLSPKQIAAQAKEIKKKETGDTISRLHELLDAQITEMFKGYQGDYIPDLTDYENVKESDKNKRIKEAIKRESYAEQITRYEADHGDSPEIISGNVRDKEELLRNINEFMENTSKEFSIDTDEKFVNNLAENYERCFKAETVKKMLDEAVEGGYLPEDIDTKSVLNRIAGYEELRFYIDNRKELMKNKYYKYFTSDDVAYTDRQIEHMIRKLEKSQNNDELLSYLRHVSALRKQGFKRKKGIKSESEKIDKRSKDQDEILRSKHEKRMIIEEMTDNALSFSASPAFRNKDYDSGFTRELFMRKLYEFNRLKVTDLHMGSVKDLALHFAENSRMFEQAREFENYLFMASRLGGMEVSDRDMIKLRAKIRVFSDAEKLVSHLQENLLRHPEEAINDMTYADIEKKAADDAFRSNASFKDDVPVIKLGMNLNKHFNAITGIYKKEHEDRRENIRRIYGLMHPVKENTENGEDIIRPGEISGEELNKRVSAYQKNALYAEHIINGHQYLLVVWNRKMNCFREAYLKRTGIDAAGAIKPERSLSAYTAGMSSKEYMELVNLLDHGKEEDKEKFYKSMLKTVENLDPDVFDLREGTKTMGNLYYKFAMNGFTANFEDFAQYLKDPEDIAKAKAYHGVGCGFFVDHQNVAQKYIASGKYARAVMTEDMFKYFDTYEEFSSFCEDYMDENDEYVQNDFTYISNGEWGELSKIMSGPQFANTSRVPLKYRNLPGQNEYIGTPQTCKYEEFKRFGIWKDTSEEDLASIKKFMSEHTGENAVKTEMTAFAQNLSKQVPKADAGDDAIRRYCADAEKVFARVMSFDPAEFSFDSYKDIISDEKKFTKCSECISLAESAAGLLEHYRSFYDNRGEKKYGKVLKLNKDYIKEIEARLDLIKCAKPFFDGEFAALCESPLVAEYGSIDEMLHQSEKIYRDKIAAAKKDNKTKDAETHEKILEFIKKLDGFDIYTPLNVIERRYRNKHGIRSDRYSTPKEVANVLSGTKSILKGKKPGHIKVEAFGKEDFEQSLKAYFAEKELTVREREKLLNTTGTQQNVKNKNKDALTEARMKVSNGLCGIKNKISLNNRVAAGEEAIDSLLPFMKSDDTRYNEELVKKYIDQESRDSVIDEMTRQVTSLNMDLNLKSDAAFAKNTQALEYITRVAYAYRNILKANPDYMERLKNRQSGSEKNDYRIVTDKVNRMFVISDYYRARKLLITNSYYVLHENDELCSDKKSARTPEQLKIAELYEIVNKCADRLKDGIYDERDNDNMEQILSVLEMKATGDAHMTGRVDLSAISVSKLKKTHSNISRFIEEAMLENEEEPGINVENLHKLHNVIDDKNAFPDMKKVLTPEVRAIIKATIIDAGMNRKFTFPGSDEICYNDRQKIVREHIKTFLTCEQEERDEKTNKVIKPAVLYSSFALANPKNKDEVYDFHTNPARLMGDIVFLLGDEASEEEIMDMFDGLLIGQKGELDLNDEKQWEYAKNRWLRSVKKLYDLETAAVLKYEQTYGALIGQIPVGNFVQSLGSGLVEFHIRSRFAGQNVLELCDEQHIKTGDGKELSVGELLVKEGLISKAHDEKCRQLAGSYQQKSSYVATYYRGLLDNFGDGDNYDSDYGTTYGEASNWLYADSQSPVEGPRLSKAMRRKLWKEAEASEDRNILGGVNVLAVNKPKLNVYSSSERKEMKKQRAKDLKIAKYAAAYMDTRAEDLYEETIKAINGENLPKETKSLIRDTLVNFHPAMYQSGKMEKKIINGKEVLKETGIAGIDAFYENVKKFLGIGVGEGNLIKAKQEAFDAFSFNSKLFIVDPNSMNDPDDIMSKGKVRESDYNVINGTNPLLKLEAKHRMYGALQDLASAYDVKTWMDKKIHEEYRDTLKRHLRTEMLYAFMRSDFYLNMKDIENPGKTFTERNYDLIRDIGVFESSKSSFELDRDILTDEAVIAFNEFGIRIDAPVYEEEKPVEVPVEKKVDKTKKTDKAEADKKGAAVSEKEKAPVAVEKEKASAVKEKEKDSSVKEKTEVDRQLNVINIIEETEDEKEEDAPAIMAPVFEGLQYDHQGPTQYCWACTLAGLMNAYAGKQITNLATITKQSSRLKAPSYAQSGFADMKSYQDAVGFAKSMYSGLRTGNPSLVGDYVHKVLPNTAVRSVMIGVERGKEAESETEFRRIAAEQIKKGPFGILHNGHYVLVRGIQGDRLLVNNSLAKDPSEVAPYDYKISQIFSVGEDDPKIKQIEMVWLQNMKGSEQAIADEFKFAYNAQTGEFKVDDTRKKDSQGKGKETILHRDGIEGSYISANEMVAQQIYIPKFMSGDQAGAGEPVVEQPIEQHEDQQMREVEKDAGEQPLEDNIIQPVLQTVVEPKIKEPVVQEDEEKVIKKPEGKKVVKGEEKPGEKKAVKEKEKAEDKKGVKEKEKAEERAKEKAEDKKAGKEKEKAEDKKAVKEAKKEENKGKKTENKNEIKESRIEIEEDPIEAGYKEEKSRIDEVYKGSGIPKKDLKHVKEATEAKWRYVKKANASLPKKESEELEKMQSSIDHGFDPRGFKVLLRPVNVDKNGDPLTEEDKKNLELNVRDFENYKKNSISARKPHLDYLVNDMIENMFSPDQLKDPDYIRNNKERAIRFISQVHYISDHIRAHWKYYLTQADPKIRVFAFLFRGSFYSDMVTISINTALYGYGFGSAIIGSSSQYGTVIPYRKGDNYKLIKKENEKLAGKSSYYGMATITTYEALYSEDRNKPFTKEGKRMIEEARSDDDNLMYSFSAPLQYEITKKYGQKNDRDKIDNDLVLGITADKMGEFFKKKNNKKYIDSVLKDINEYMSIYEQNPENTNTLKDDLK